MAQYSVPVNNGDFSKAKRETIRNLLQEVAVPLAYRKVELVNCDQLLAIILRVLRETWTVLNRNPEILNIEDRLKISGTPEFEIQQICKKEKKWVPENLYESLKKELDFALTEWKNGDSENPSVIGDENPRISGEKSRF